MKIRNEAALCAVIAACGMLAAAPEASAQTKRRGKPAPARPFEGWDRGGLVGSSNAPAPVRRPAITPAWLVGAWGLNGCTSPAFYKRIGGNGQFESADEHGTWQLGAEQGAPIVTLSYRRDGDVPGRALRVEELAAGRDGDDRLRLNVGWWVRCSPDPGATLAGFGPSRFARVAAPQNAPSAGDRWAGDYKGQPSGGGVEIGIRPTGGGRYEVRAFWGSKTTGGAYNLDGWEGTAEADGEVLIISRNDGDEPLVCGMTIVPGASYPYRMDGCGGGDGVYRRTPATRAATPARPAPTQAATPAGLWTAPAGSADKIGIVRRRGDLSFAPLYLTCESGALTVTMTGFNSAPSASRVTFTVDDQTFAVPVSPVEGMSGDWNLTGTLSTGHPLLKALPGATTLSMAAQGRASALPVTGLRAAWPAFQRRCNIR